MIAPPLSSPPLMSFQLISTVLCLSTCVYLQSNAGGGSMHLVCRPPRHTLPKKKKPLLSSARLHLFMLTADQRVFAPVHNTWMDNGVPFITMPLFLILETAKTTQSWPRHGL